MCVAAPTYERRFGPQRKDVDDHAGGASADTRTGYYEHQRTSGMGRLRQLAFLLGIVAVAYVLKKGQDDTVNHTAPATPGESGASGDQ